MKQPVGKLSVLTGPEAGSFYLLVRDEYTLGRGEENAIIIYETSASRIHCRIFKAEDKYFICDLNTTNGTYLRGARLMPNRNYDLEPGSHINLGNAEFFFSVDMVELGPRETAAERRASAPPGGDAPGLFDESPDEEESTAEIHPESLARGKRVSSTMPFNIFSSRNLVAIYRILGSVGSINDRQYFIEKSLHLIIEVMRADKGYLFLMEDLERGEFKPAVAESKKGKVEIPTGDIDNSMIHRVLKEGIAILSSGVPGELGFPASASMAEGNMVSAICAPLQSRDKLFGVMYIEAVAGVRDFEKDEVELLSAIGIHLGALLENIELSLRHQDLFLGVIRTLVHIIEAKDKYTLGHSERVTTISMAVADELGLDPDKKEAIRISGLIHDIGKVSVPEEILNKPCALTEEEYAVIKKHPVVGSNFVGHLEGFDEVRNGILFHHERYDGKGYPNRLAGESIPIIARVIAAADAFDAMTSDRPYRRGFSDKHALQVLESHKGSQFDPDVVDAFVRAFNKGNIVLKKSV